MSVAIEGLSLIHILLVFTGGLGPTADDLTKETVAACFGDELAFDEAEWEKICLLYTSRCV